MLIFHRKGQMAVDQLVEGFAERQISRRAFLQHAAAGGLSLGAASSLLAACGQYDTPRGLDVLNVWSGEEQASFKATVAPFSIETGIEVTLEVTRDLKHDLTLHFENKQPPDIAILPNPGYMQELVDQNYLIPLDSFLDMNQIRQDYAQSWIDLGSYNGHLYALFYKAANKGTIWYSPKQFQSLNYQTPTTWDELIALSDRIAQNGQYPWALGVASTNSNGWPGADWIAEIYLNQFGPQMYDQWVKHEIPWTDASVKQAFQYFGEIVNGRHYISGAPQSILIMNYQAASFLPFNTPPAAYMYYLGDFTEGFIKDQFKKAMPGVDFDFFHFPTLNPRYAGAVTGGADVVVVTRDTTEVRQLVQYMATAQAQEIWVKRGGFTSPNKSVNLSAYPDPVARASAQMLTQAPIYRFGADDLMPSSVEQAFWTGVLAFINDQSQLDSILEAIELADQQAR